MAKPFAVPELVAGVRALRAVMPEVPALTLGVGDLTLELVNHAVHRDRRKIELSARELILLKVLMREPGRVFTRTELCERVWEDPHNTTRTGGSFHRTLTKKMGDSPLIHTVRHVGYAICESSAPSGEPQK